MLILIFVLIVLSPCVAAFLGGTDEGLDLYKEQKGSTAARAEAGVDGAGGSLSSM